MYFQFRWLIVVAATCCSAALVQAGPDRPDRNDKIGHSSRTNRVAREKWFYDQRAYPLSTIPKNARLRALAEIAAATSTSAETNSATSITSNASITALTATLWTNIGPAPILDGP